LLSCADTLKEIITNSVLSCSQREELKIDAQRNRN
jgi:hypothetical protein